MSPLNFDGTPRQVVCECCAPRMYSFTSTTGHKWTRDEIVDEILYFSAKVAKGNFFTRGNAIERLRHWTEKLERLDELKSEFA